jgi:uncharacterized Zn finger protein (UPF0148 family)
MKIKSDLKEFGVESNYLVAFACFKCRRAFKHPLIQGEWERICPVCKGTEYAMGRKFRSPAKDKILEWKIIELITIRGYWGDFQSATGRRIPFPKTMEKAKEFLEEIDRQKLLAARIRKANEMRVKRDQKARMKRQAERIKARESK